MRIFNLAVRGSPDRRKRLIAIFFGMSFILAVFLLVLPISAMAVASGVSPMDSSILTCTNQGTALTMTSANYIGTLDEKNKTLEPVIRTSNLNEPITMRKKSMTNVLVETSVQEFYVAWRTKKGVVVLKCPSYTAMKDSLYAKLSKIGASGPAVEIQPQ